MNGGLLKRAYFMRDANSKTEIAYLDLSTGQIRQVYVLEKSPFPWIGGLKVSPDGAWLLYTQVDDTQSDLMMIENWN